MPMPELKATLTDIGTEELGHMEMIGTILYQLTKDLTVEQIKAAGFDDYFVDHTLGVYPQSAAGVPFTTAYLQSKGDAITDLHEDLAADENAMETQPVATLTTSYSILIYSYTQYIVGFYLASFYKIVQYITIKRNKKAPPAEFREGAIFFAIFILSLARPPIMFFILPRIALYCVFMVY